MACVYQFDTPTSDPKTMIEEECMNKYKGFSPHWDEKNKKCNIKLPMCVFPYENHKLYQVFKTVPSGKQVSHMCHDSTPPCEASIFTDFGDFSLTSSLNFELPGQKEFVPFKTPNQFEQCDFQVCFDGNKQVSCDAKWTRKDLYRLAPSEKNPTNPLFTPMQTCTSPCGEDLLTGMNIGGGKNAVSPCSAQ